VITTISNLILSPASATTTSTDDLTAACRELSTTYLQLSSALAEQGAVAEAEEMARSGARALAASILSQLGASPAHNPAPVEGASASRISGLTMQERRVAGLAVLGKSNKEIAALLFISVGTVEQHLSRCYKKLRINGRAALPAELRDYAPAS
jgi:DNA-binding NarL/FixJ family response regulator